MTGAIDGWPEAKVSKRLAYFALFSPNPKSFSFSGQCDENKPILNSSISIRIKIFTCQHHNSYVTTIDTQYNDYYTIPPSACWWLDSCCSGYLRQNSYEVEYHYFAQISIRFFSIYYVYIDSIALLSNCVVAVSSRGMHGASCHFSLDNDKHNKYLHAK